MTTTGWVRTDPAEYSDALQAEVFWHEAREQLALLQEKLDLDQPEVWTIYCVLHPDEDGMSGLEAIDGSQDYEEAKEIAHEMAQELMAG